MAVTGHSTNQTKSYKNAKDVRKLFMWQKNPVANSRRKGSHFLHFPSSLQNTFLWVKIRFWLSERELLKRRWAKVIWIGKVLNYYNTSMVPGPYWLGWMEVWKSFRRSSRIVLFLVTRGYLSTRGRGIHQHYTVTTLASSLAYEYIVAGTLQKMP